MTLSQLLVSIDKNECRKIVISVEFCDGSHTEPIKFSPYAVNEIFASISPLSRVIAFFDRKGSVNIVVDYAAQPITISKQIADGVWGEPTYV